MAFAAQIQNLPPTPPTPVVVQAKPKRRRTGGGDFSESNLYDPIEGDYNHPYYDNSAVEEAALADIQTWAKVLVGILEDQARVKLSALAKGVVNSGVGVSVGQPAETIVSTSTLSVEVDVFDIITGVDDGDD